MPALSRAALVLLQLHLASAAVLNSRQQVTCSYATAANSGDTCQSFSAEWGLTTSTFESLNPGVSCPNLVAGQSYCVIGTASSSTTSAAALTPTVSTSLTSSSTSSQYQPQQTGTAANCNQFYLVPPGASCDAIETQFDITASEFIAWNPSINSDCTNILAGYYYCVNVAGATKPATTTTSPAVTKPSNGITTPTPIQDGMTGNCNKFDLVQSGDTCDAIASKYGIPLSTFYTWNPAVGSSCAYLDLGDYVCVSTIGYATPTKTASAGNGISTPTPYEPGMVSNCNKFYFVRSGDTCAAVASSQHVATSQIEQWNPHVGSSCTDLWLGVYICVGVQY
ncbi:Hypothetical protein R9X50_00088000 [Acrodontium crateriforme]|uniref:LysM domain-containing protein n=1 Tax=Acrodontium crateriforme TaxID=150365 RepID=A0AAQ3R7L0_9PEZI|nr:Hypothetical protein R9X50_00088000 [Acrodontium crateriforme]